MGTVGEGLANEVGLFLRFNSASTLPNGCDARYQAPQSNGSTYDQRSDPS